MTNKICSIAALLLLTLLTACQKVINLNLKTAPAKYVIEGNVTNLPGPYQVTIGQTQAVDSNYSFNGVSQATVTIRDNAGDSETLVEIQPGVYQTIALQGVQGRRYDLTVIIGEKSYTASSIMPQQVNLDSLYIEQVLNGSKEVLAVVPYFLNPADTGHYYRFNQYINGSLDKTLYEFNDDFTYGLPSTYSLLRTSQDSTLHASDRVDVEMQCLDYAVYHYWYSADLTSLGGNNGSQPGNPVTNIQGGALGYFSANTAQTKTIFVK